MVEYIYAERDLRDWKRRARRAEQQRTRLQRVTKHLREHITKLEAGMAHYHKRLRAANYVFCSGCHCRKNDVTFEDVALIVRNTVRLVESFPQRLIPEEHQPTIAGLHAALTPFARETYYVTEVHHRDTHLCPRCSTRSVWKQDNGVVSCLYCGMKEMVDVT